VAAKPTLSIKTW
jgi:hypothetical protein